MTKKITLHILILLVFIGCKSTSDPLKKMFLRSGKDNKGHYNHQLTEFSDKNVFYLSIIIHSKDSLQSKKRVKVTNNRPLSGHKYKTAEGYEYIRYTLSSPLFEVSTDNNGKLDLVFQSTKNFTLSIPGVFSLYVEPKLGIKMDLNVYLD